MRSIRRIKVSDHALLRFIERAGGLDVEGLRRMIASSLDRAAATAQCLGEQRFRIVADGLIFVVIDDRDDVPCVITVLDARKRGPVGRE